VILRTSGNGTRFKWQSSTGPPLPDVPMPQAVPLQSTTYTITAFISQCSMQEEIVVRAIPYPLLNAGQDIAICFAQSVNLLAVTNGNRVQWTPADLLSNAFVENPVATPAQTTSFIVAAYGNEGCPKPSFDTIVVNVEPPISMQGVKDTTIVIGQPLVMNVTGAPTFSWTPIDNISNASIGNPVILFNQATEGVRYKVIGSNPAGCSDSLEFIIKVFSTVPSVFVPTAFTPNGDGLNETLKPTLAGMQQMNYFRVFNRYGQIVFQSSSLYDAWDGWFKGQKQPSGSYMWMVQAVDFEGKAVQQKGSTMLIR
jgi:gliding motility-associated-like protein